MNQSTNSPAKGNTASKLSLTNEPTLENRIIGPQEADKILVIPDWQRSRKKSALAKYATDMDNGDWFDWTVLVFVIVRQSGITYCIDGQHRLASVIASSCPIGFTVQTFTVHNDEQARELYYLIDRGAKRTSRDIGRSVGLARQVGLTETQTAYLQSAVVEMQSGITRDGHASAKVSDQERHALTIANRNIGESFFDAVAGCPGDAFKAIIRSDVMAIALLTFEAEAELARSFWRRVAMGTELSGDDPRWHLRQWLLSVRIHSGKRLSVTHNDLRLMSAAAWNSWTDARTWSRLPAISRIKPVINLHPLWSEVKA